MTATRQTISPIALVAILLSSTVCSQVLAAGETASGSASGLPVPRYVSLKSDRVNVRSGPTRDHEVSWVFTRSGLPVEITAEFENWRRIRDSEGSEGWVYHSLLSGRRTAVVTARNKDQLVAVSDSPKADGDVTAQLQPGVVAQVKRCDGKWCKVNGNQFEGWIPQERLWGVYPNEKVD
ncbi:SH3 domain-containing protein [Pseudorhodoplanes sp.]|uniref:SH3 domain-containing protein n=1 Tax=Pseudorhodoplanes sp. TaxID=1934341 RepID=UPI002D12C126|nr:SH3 domain-containing protein [Pseudorhodoplanes sp.]HWV50963.1 SH3 domain-containing protein [Pseudorhodoplanes sp.]